MTTYNTVSVTGNNIFGNSSGEVVNVTCTPLSLYFDTVNNTEINAPAATATANVSGAWTLSGLIDPTPAGTGLAWELTVTDKGTRQVLYNATVQIAFANGASQQWLALTPPPPPATATTYLVTPSSVPGAAGQFLTSTAASSNVLSWNYGNNPLNVKNFQADPTGVADSTTAINNAIAAATGNAAPATHSRAATNAVYLPCGTYKVTADLLVQSVQGFNFIGDGAELTILNASGSGFTTAVLNVDGSYAGRYEGFTIKGDGTEQVPNGVNLTWTVAANRSTTGNKFADIRMRNLNFVTGFSMAGITNRQVDSTRLDCIVVSGQQVPGSWSNTGNWQKGFEFGNGTFANIYDQVLTRCEPSGCYYGYYNNVSGFSLNGAQPANNFCDFYINPGAQTTITNIQSQNSGQFLIAPSNFSPQPVSFNDCQFKSVNMSSANGNAFITLGGGTWNFNNLSASATQNPGGGVYVGATVAITGSAGSRPCFASFNNLALFGARTSAFTLSNAVVTVQNYENYNPNTGNYTTATGDPLSINTGNSWSSLTGVTPPQVNFISATGNTTYTIPAGAQTVDTTVVGGAGGGGSGAFAAAGNCGGGSGGGGGGYSRQQFQVSQLASPVTVTVGAGGGGGNAVTTASAGNAGGAGNSSLFGAYMWAHGGVGGGAGNATNGAAVGGGAGGGGMISGSAGGPTVTSAGPGGAGVGSTTSGGGAGGGVVGGVAENGGGAGTTWLGTNANSSAGGIVGGASPTNGTAVTVQGDTAPGGGGGAAALSGAAQDGAAGQSSTGAGGGGGGACQAGTTSGKGGAGGSGYALIIAYFQ